VLAGNVHEIASAADPRARVVYVDVAMEKLFNEKLGTGRWRSREEILSWFGDWEILEPGLVPLPEWRPDVRGSTKRNATYYGFVGGVARKK
jgi:S-adenosyl methyltransferase